MSETQHTAPSLKLISEVSQCVEAFGIEGTVKILNEYRITSLLVGHEDIKTLIISTAKHLELPVMEILEGISRNKGRKPALGIITLLMEEEIQLTMPEIAIVLKKDKGNLSRYKEELKRMKPERRKHGPILQALDKVRSDYRIYKLQQLTPKT